MDEFELIPAAQWRRFCEDFSRSHRGWLVRLWVLDTAGLEAGSVEASDVSLRDLQLREISLEGRGGRTDLMIMVSAGAGHVDHRVGGIESITLERDPDGTESGLRVDSADGQTSLLRFRVPARPEALDGLAPGEKP